MKIYRVRMSNDPTCINKYIVECKAWCGWRYVDMFAVETDAIICAKRLSQPEVVWQSDAKEP